MEVEGKAALKCQGKKFKLPFISNREPLEFLSSRI